MKTNFKKDNHNPEISHKEKEKDVQRKEDEGGKERETQREEERRDTAN